MPHGQAEALLPMVERAMREAGWRPRRSISIAVTTGPGSFTGIRVGLAAARGIALALDLPLIGVTSFEAAAAALGDADPADAFSSGRSRKPARRFIHPILRSPMAVRSALPAAVLPEALGRDRDAAATGAGPLTVTGDAAPRAAAALAGRGCASIVEDARAAPRSAPSARPCGDGAAASAAAAARPLYLRPPDVTLAPRPLLPRRS